MNRIYLRATDVRYEKLATCLLNQSYVKEANALIKRKNSERSPWVNLMYAKRASSVFETALLRSPILLRAST